MDMPKVHLRKLERSLADTGESPQCPLDPLLLTALRSRGELAWFAKQICHSFAMAIDGTLVEWPENRNAAASVLPKGGSLT